MYLRLFFFEGCINTCTWFVRPFVVWGVFQGDSEQAWQWLDMNIQVPRLGLPVLWQSVGRIMLLIRCRGVVVTEYGRHCEYIWCQHVDDLASCNYGLFLFFHLFFAFLTFFSRREDETRMSIGAWLFTGTWHGQNVAPACRSSIITIVVNSHDYYCPPIKTPRKRSEDKRKTTGITIETTRLLFHTYLDKVILLPEMAWLGFLVSFWIRRLSIFPAVSAKVK